MMITVNFPVGVYFLLSAIVAIMFVFLVVWLAGKR